MITRGGRFNESLPDCECVRFRPAKDKRGKPVRAGVIENHTWVARDQ
jgi:hypothetical protein